ncbi:MAG: putative metal-binding motif-containing protein [Nitrospiraceae bacterium]|nr:MAG: putative metal-binding motif-containing protein [Nitrospiraceae bacterium]
MKLIRNISIILLLSFITIQCGGGGKDKNGSGTTPVIIKVAEVTQETGSGINQLSGLVTTGDLASAVADSEGQGRQLSLCRFTITGPGMEDIVREVDIAGKSSISETFNVPSGINRSFLIQMFIENNDAVIVQAHSGGHNLEGVPKEILMKPTMQADYYEPPEFSGILSVSNSETRSVMLSWKPAVDNITEQERIQYLIYLTTQSKRDNADDNDIMSVYELGKGTERDEDPLMFYSYEGDELILISYEFEGTVPAEGETVPGILDTETETGRLDPGIPYYFLVRASDEWGYEESNLVESEQIVVYMLDVEVQGRGTVTSDPKGIDCGTKCSEDFLSKKEVALTARADEGAVFKGWTGCENYVETGNCTLTLTQNESVTATFSSINSCLNGDIDCSLLNDQCNTGECDEITGDCIKVPANEGLGCDDGQYCTEGETCQIGTCTGGNARICSDGVGCTDDICDEASDTCLYTPNNAKCQDNVQFCDGNEICDPLNDCASTGNPCLPGETCDEAQDKCNPPVQCGNGILDQGEECDNGSTNGTTVCGCQTNCTYTPISTSCGDGAFCNGEETCDGSGTCQPSIPVDCSDGIGCTDDSCDEVNDTCVNVPNNANCPDNGQFCDGTEICDSINDCLSTGDPCKQGETCDDAQDTCVVNCTDNDNDGYGKFGQASCQNAGIDCNDNDNTVHPAANEKCDGEDNNCNGQIDEEVTNACGTCGPVPQEVCDGVDNDCDGKVDEGVTNACGTCGSVPQEVCDGIDNDCDGKVDEGVTNACGTCGSVPQEVCDGIDNDCDGKVDEGVTNACGTCGSVPKEVCDGVDNDCDGKTDEVCGPGDFCGYNSYGSILVHDCNMNCYPASYEGDSICDDGINISSDFMCPELNYDGGDCIDTNFIGTWINNDPYTGGTSRIIIGQSGSNMTVHGFGACTPTDCDWGTVTVPYTGNPFVAVYEFGFKTTTLTIKLLSIDSLHVHSVHIYHDGRPNYTDDEYFHQLYIY